MRLPIWWSHLFLYKRETFRKSGFDYLNEFDLSQALTFRGFETALQI